MTSQSESNQTAVFIVDDHPLMRRTLCEVINLVPGLHVCGDAETAEAALTKIPHCRPHLVLIDISLPDIGGLELIQILRQKYPELLLLVLSGHEETIFAEKSIQAGANGYVMKGKMPELIQCIQRILNGQNHSGSALDQANNHNQDPANFPA